MTLDPQALARAVVAYDDARRSAFGRKNEPAMSEANRESIAPMIGAAILAYHRAISEGPPRLCALCEGPHDNDLCSDICTQCEERAEWRGEA